MRAVLLAALLGNAVLIQQGAPPKHVLHVVVEDERGTPLNPVTADEFEILLDDAPVTIDDAAAERDALSLMILIDVTRSSRWRARPLDEQLAGFAAKLAPADRVGIGTFGATLSLGPLLPVGSHIRNAVRRAVDLPDSRREGPSPVWDAVHETVTLLATQPAPRAVLLLTDGRTTGNHRSLEEVAEYAVARQVSVHVVAQHAAQYIRQQQRDGATAARVRPAAPLQRLAEYSGGQVFVYPERQHDEAERLFTFLADRLRAMHALTFTPPATGTHRLEVRVKRPGARVLAPLSIVTDRRSAQKSKRKLNRDLIFAAFSGRTIPPFEASAVSIFF